ncbi:hypothetical protein, partial [Klebsiella pneumoniae]|uniref:hypothetical protein n=1 Tax=Klebsiella pneumoniae TaxID=573 RepID=UPI002FF13D2D
IWCIMCICMTINIRLRKLVQQITQILHVNESDIVGNERCNPHGARLYVKFVIVTFVIIQSMNDRFTLGNYGVFTLARRLINR